MIASKSDSPSVPEIVAHYVGRGLAPVPVPFRSKAPRVSGWEKLRIGPDEIREHFNGSPQNIGIILGEPSGGLIDVDLDCDEAIRLAGPLLPATGAVFGRASKPRSHHLYLTGDASRVTRLTFRGESLVELRGTGGQTIFPGSVHESGEHVEWAKDGELSRLALEGLSRAVHELAAAVLLVRNYPRQGSRHAYTMAVAGGFLRAGFDIERVREIIGAIARAADDEEAAKRMDNVATTAARLTAGSSTTGWPTTSEIIGQDGVAVVEQIRRWLGIKGDSSDRHGLLGYLRTDVGNAQRFVSRHGAELRFCDPLSRWLVWDGMRWRQDDTGEVMRRAKKTMRAAFQEAVAIPADDESRDEFVRFFLRSEHRARLEALIALAQSESEVVVHPDDLDADRWSLNCASGVIDLRSGELRPHDPGLLCTKLAPVAYDPGAPSPAWQEFINEITSGLPDVATYLQQLAGIWLTGDVSEQFLPVFWGGGNNGKSTYIDTILHVLGDYATVAAPELLVARQWSSHPTEVADLVGRRLVVGDETERGQQLRIGFVKRATGDARLKGRFMRRDFFEFDRTFKLLLVTNNRPRVDEDSVAVWRRLRLVPFTFEPPEPDRRLPEKLLAEAPGILAWMVRGCLSWQQDGLQTPPEVQTATDEYRSESDIVGRFCEEALTFAPEFWTSSSRLTDAFAEWCREHDTTIGVCELWRKLHDLACTRTSPRRGQGRGWKGVSIVIEAESVD